jgi:transketolase
MRRHFALTLEDIARADPRVVLLTADLGFGVLEDFARAYPDRFFNVGVAEANMVGLATGLAEAGYIPFMYSIATFATLRPYEQLRNGPILQRLPARLVGVGGGFEYGINGLTHAALEDFGVMRLQPAMQVIVPADEAQAVNALRATYDAPGPVYYRISKRQELRLPGLEGRFRLGRTETILEGDDALIASIGAITDEALAAAELLRDEGIRATVAVVSSFNPAPVEDLKALLARFPAAVTVEAHYATGGLGSLVAELIAESGINCRLQRCGVFALPGAVSGSEGHMNQLHGIDREGIASALRRVLGR